MVNNAGQLCAGVFEVDITPGMGVQIAGDIGKHRGVVRVDDPLFARVMILEAGEVKIGLVSLDLLIAVEPYITMIRRRVQRETGIAPEALLIHTTHSHGAPGIGGLVAQRGFPLITPDLAWLCGDEGYEHWVVEKIADAVKQANARLQPVTIGWGSGLEARVAFNRRFVMRDGTVHTHPQTTNILHVEGPMDPEVGVVAVKSTEGTILGMLLNHTCHPTHGYADWYVTAGWPGVWATKVKEILGPQCVPLVFTGFAGNIHHHHHLDPTHDSTSGRLGTLLAEDTVQIMDKISFQNNLDIDYRDRKLNIPFRPVPPDVLQEAKQLLADHPTPIWKPNERENIEWRWVYAVSRVGLHEIQQKNPFQECEVQVFRIGSMGFVGVPGEPFVEGQLKIKLKSPFYPTYASGNCNAHVGYIPTPRALEAGGYETRIGNWSKLAPEALDTIADNAIDMLKEMKK